MFESFLKKKKKMFESLFKKLDLSLYFIFIYHK